MTQTKWMYVGLAIMLVAGVKVFVTLPISVLILGLGFIIYALNRDEV